MTLCSGPAVLRRGALRAVGTPTESPFVYLDANLELDPAPDGATRLTLMGSYLSRPAVSGADLSRAVVRQVARATLGAFLLSLGQLLMSGPLAPKTPRPRSTV